ncbi:hypothetical protein A2U01_0105928, partial [Trifolium medium]|nr:hypothetical protein [Trifolium medium]
VAFVTYFFTVEAEIPGTQWTSAETDAIAVVTSTKRGFNVG